MQLVASTLLLLSAAAALRLPPVVILPGFGNDAIDYVAPLDQPEDVGLCSVLRRRGFTDVSVVPVSANTIPLRMCTCARVRARA